MASPILQISSVALSQATPPQNQTAATKVATLAGPNPLVQQVAAAVSAAGVHSSDKKRAPKIDQKQVEDPFARDEKRALGDVGDDEEDQESAAEGLFEEDGSKKSLDVLA